MQTKFIIDNADYNDWNEYAKWLNEQASNGLYFKRHILGITVFSKCQEKSKWEYTCVPANDHADTLSALATLRVDGWERVSRGCNRVYRIDAKRPISYIPTVESRHLSAKGFVILQIVFAVFCLVLWYLIYVAPSSMQTAKTAAIVGGALFTALMAFVDAEVIYAYAKRKQKKRMSRYVPFFFTMVQLAFAMAFIAFRVALVFLIY